MVKSVNGSPEFGKGNYESLEKRAPSKSTVLKKGTISWMKSTFTPLAKVCHLIAKDIIKTFQWEAKTPKEFAVNKVTRLLSILKWGGILTLASVHAVTHLIPTAQVALKISEIAAKGKGWKYAPLKAFATIISPFTFLTNIPAISRLAVFISGSRIYKALNSDAIAKQKEGFAKWLEKNSSPPDPTIGSHETLTIPVIDPSTGGEINLKGYYFTPTKKPKGTIILQHGNGGSYQSDIGAIESYLKEGYAVVAYNRRGCIDSEGTPTQANVVNDCETVVNYARNSLEASSITIHGHSMGGLIAAQASQRNSLRDVNIILDRTGTDLRSTVENIASSWGADLLETFSDNSFHNREAIEHLKKEGRLFIVRSANVLGEAGDEIFKQNEVGHVYGRSDDELKKAKLELKKLGELQKKERELAPNLWVSCNKKSSKSLQNKVKNIEKIFTDPDAYLFGENLEVFIELYPKLKQACEDILTLANKIEENPFIITEEELKEFKEQISVFASYYEDEGFSQEAKECKKIVKTVEELLQTKSAIKKQSQSETFFHEDVVLNLGDITNTHNARLQPYVYGHIDDWLTKRS